METLRNFFDTAAEEARAMVAFPPFPSPQRVLDKALGTAMSRWTPGGRVFVLQPGEGRQARAQLLAASAGVLGPPSDTMVPGESVEERLASGFHRLRLDQVEPLLRAAAVEDIDPAKLEARAR
jgi:hypothetical protein